MKKIEYIPFKVTQRFVFVQSVFVILVGVVFVFFHHRYPRVDKDVLILLLSLFSLFYTVVLAYLFISPLGRLLAKAKSIKRGTYHRDWDQSHEPVQDFGEWYELDLTLNKLNREIKKHKEDRLRRDIEIETLAGAVSDGVIAIDGFKRVQYYNHAMAAILGKNFDPLAPPAYLDEVFRAPKLTLAVDEVIREKASRNNIHIPMRPYKMMENHIFEVTVSPVINDKKDKFYGVIAVFHDITEAKKVEDLRIDFVANASHELKTPLTVVKGYLEALRVDLESQKPAQAQEKLVVIERNVEKLNDLVVDLLALSRLDAGLEAVKEVIATQEITEEILKELKSSFKDKKPNFESEYKVESVVANRVLVEQVLSNLVENAVKYCPEGTRVRVFWSQTEKDVVLRVSDDGPGISEEHASRVFERFYRVQNNKLKNTVAGTGLGLSIAKNSMLKMGGRIEVESLPGRGTDFICSFPR